MKTNVPIDLNATLFCGQIFHFDTLDNGLFIGNVHGHPAILAQLENKVYFFETCRQIENALITFFNLDVEVPDTFSKSGLRFITNDFESAVYSFVCSTNNKISRITKMVKFIYSLGDRIDVNKMYREHLQTDSSNELHPSLKFLPDITKDLENFQIHLLPNPATVADSEAKFQNAKFGYRAKYVADAGKYLLQFNKNWADFTYEEARNELLAIKGVGRKVADCICLTSLKFFHVVPLDVHIIRHSLVEFDLGYRKVYKKQYAEIQKLWVEKYGAFAGIQQLHVFKMIIDSQKGETPEKR